jgi:hypothetical protein
MPLTKQQLYDQVFAPEIDELISNQLIGTTGNLNEYSIKYTRKVGKNGLEFRTRIYYVKNEGTQNEDATLKDDRSTELEDTVVDFLNTTFGNDLLGYGIKGIDEDFMTATVNVVRLVQDSKANDVAVKQTIIVYKEREQPITWVPYYEFNDLP